MTEKTCSFCHDFNGGQGHYNVLIGNRDGIHVIADAAPVLPGHLLLCPTEHKRSLSQLDEDAFRTIDGLVERFANACRQQGLFPLIAEHGSGGVGEHSNACCDHAHLHMIPLPDAAAFQRIIAAFERHGGEATTQPALRNIRTLGDQSYNLVAGPDGPIRVWSDTHRFFNQFFRFAIYQALPELIDQSKLFWQGSIDLGGAIATARDWEGPLFETSRWRSGELKDIRKVVRGRIPEIISDRGDYAFLPLNNDGPQRSDLLAKVIEEAREFTEAPSVEEGADILEAIEAALGYPPEFIEDLISAKTDKAAERGDLRDQVFLLGTFHFPESGHD